MMRKAMGWLLLCMVLAGCGGNESGASRPTAAPRASLDGLLLGTITTATGTSNLAGVYVGGRLMLLQSRAGQYEAFYDAAVSGDATALSSTSVRRYADGSDQIAGLRRFSETASLQATAPDNAAWSGTLTTATGTAPFSLRYDDAVYELDSSLTYITGSWSTGGSAAYTLVADGAGNSSASFTGVDCVGEGAIGLIDAQFNPYTYEVNFAGTECGTLGGDYSGFIVLNATVVPYDTLAAVFASSDAFGVVSLRRQ